jgi:tetratricopeptide (TPR) repeat protein
MSERSWEQSTEGAEGPLLRWIARNERPAALIWLSGCAAVLFVLGAWGIAANGAEKAVEALDSSWVRELDGLAEDVRARRFEEALPRLEQLERDCPAVFVKHRYDKEREKLLGLLGKCYVELDRRRLARETLQRLVAFDPRNYQNHFQLAEAERAFGDELAAAAAYTQVLAIHPTHLPSVQAVIDASFDGREYASVVAAYERYLDAWLLGAVRVRVGDAAVELETQVDGRVRVLEAVFPLPAPWSGALSIETGGYSARVESIEVIPPERIGRATPHQALILQPDTSWTTDQGSSADSLAPGELAARTAEAKLFGPSLALEEGAARLRVRIALFKALPPEMWSKVSASYRNELASDAFDRAAARSRVGGCLAAGSIFID